MAYGDISAVGTLADGATPGGALEFDTTGLTPAVAQIDATHLLVAWTGAGNDGFVQVMVDNGSGSWSTVGTALEYDTDRGYQPSLCQIDSNHWLCAYSGTGADGFAVVFEVNLTTYAVTTPASAFEFDTTQCDWPSVCKLDATHFLVCWAGPGADGFARVLEVNLSTWAVTAPTTAVEHDTGNGTQNTVVALADDHALLCYINASGFATVKSLAINTSTWAVTNFGTALTLQTVGTAGIAPSFCLIDGSTSHALVAWRQTATTSQVYAQVVTANAGTGTVTKVGSPLEIANNGGGDTELVGQSFWALAHVDGDMYAATCANTTTPTTSLAILLEVDETYAVSRITDPAVSVYTNNNITPVQHGALIVNHAERFTVVYEAADNDGYMQSFEMDLTPPAPSTYRPLSILI